MRIKTYVFTRDIIVVAGLVAAFLTLLGIVSLGAPTSLDRYLAGQIQAIPWGSLAFIPRLGSDLGGGVYGFYVVPAVAATTLGALRRWRLLALLLGVFALHYLLISPKAFITAYRPSPEFGVQGAGGLESFPSGHVQWAVSFYGFLAYLAWRVVPQRLRLPLLLSYATVVLGTILGRIELGRHWPLDTLAGVLVGLIALRILVAVHAWFHPAAPAEPVSA
jgi:undecaprenyl-diphosphatase